MRNAFEWLTLNDKAEARFVDPDLADDHAPDPGPAILFLHMSEQPHLQMQGNNQCFHMLDVEVAHVHTFHLHLASSPDVSQSRIGEGSASAHGATQWWHDEMLENVGKESAMFSRLPRQSRHWTADPSLLVTAEPKPQGGRDDELGLGLER
jgi:hypothetical protein